MIASKLSYANIVKFIEPLHVFLHEKMIGQAGCIPQMKSQFPRQANTIAISDLLGQLSMKVKIPRYDNCSGINYRRRVGRCCDTSNSDSTTSRTIDASSSCKGCIPGFEWQPSFLDCRSKTCLAKQRRFSRNCRPNSFGKGV